MPFTVKKDTDACPRSKPWAVQNPDSGRTHGCHATEAEAQQQQRALYSNVPDAGDMNSRMRAQAQRRR
jgi:hypothetical protein